jgi:hypothetical protein
MLGQVMHTVPGPEEGMPLWSLRFCVGELQIGMSEVYLLLVFKRQNIRFIWHIRGAQLNWLLQSEAPRSHEGSGHISFVELDSG